jgi:DNA mismatch repair ATPase MutS
VTFLYQLQDGACPKSYGTACARLAGMPDAILDRAEALAAQLETLGSPDAPQIEVHLNPKP